MDTQNVRFSHLSHGGGSRKNKLSPAWAYPEAALVEFPGQGHDVYFRDELRSIWLILPKLRSLDVRGRARSLR